MRDNKKLPLSFRLFGAWTVSAPVIRGVEIDEDALDAGGLARAILQVAQRELEQLRLDRSIESFLAEVQQHHSRLSSRPYLPAIVLAVARMLALSA